MNHKRFERPNFSLLFLAATAMLVFGSVSVDAAQPDLTIDVQATGITIQGVRPNGSVVLFSCSRESRYRSTFVRPAAIVLNEGGGGVIRYAPTDGIPLRSVWVAVDSTTASVAAGARKDFPLHLREFAVDNLKKDGSGDVAAVVAAIPRLSTLLVRPGVGAWMITVFDGDAKDADGRADASVQVAFASAQPVSGREKAPSHLNPKDAVVAIDPGRLDVFTWSAK
jgi:hypothetical protein